MSRYLIPVKPLSVNAAYTGKRHRTKAYNAFKKEVLLRLRPMKLPKPPYEVSYVFAVSNKGFDGDNGIKQIQDILSQKYGFNDNQIYKWNVEKVIVKKGNEYIKFDIQHYEQN